MKCGIVILNYNDYENTSRLLNEIQRFESINYIVVVDNMSSDNSYERLLKYSNERTYVISSGENGGYGKGNNVGVRYLIEHFDVDIICISNADVCFSEDFVKAILRNFSENPEYAIITGLQMKPEGGMARHPFWKCYDDNSYLLQRTCQLYLIDKFGNSPLLRNYINHTMNEKSMFQVGAVEGSLFFVRADDFIKVNMFDENVFLYFEEDILAFKIQKLGKKIGVNPLVSYIHYGAQSISKSVSSIFSIKQYKKSSIYYFDFYLCDKKLKKIIFRIITNVICLQDCIIAKLKNLLKWGN